MNVYMKWKKDAYYESIEHIHRSIELKPIVSIKNFISQQANGCVPISAVSKIGLKFGVPIKVARFLRQYPAIFKEFTGPNCNLPWFGLTSNAASIDRQEKKVYEEYKEDLRDRLKRFILMSKEKVVPLKIIQGLLWNLGLPECFMQNLDVKSDESFKLVKMEDGFPGLAIECEGKVLSVMQKKAMKKGIYSGGSMEAIEFPLFPSKGLRLRTKIRDWLSEFQKLPYICPFDDFSHLDTDSDLAEKRVIGVLHELLCLFVEHAAERKMVLCLKKHFGLPQKVHRAFERHPHMFYLSYRSKTCSVILKEAYQDDLTLERHPLLEVRKKYIGLIKESEVMLRNKRIKQGNLNIDLDLSSESCSTVKRDKVARDVL